VGNRTVSRLFRPGKYLGLGWVQATAGVSTYVIGRYLLPPAEGSSHTNKVAHIGFDLVRAQILTQALTYGIKYSGQRKRPTGECCAFPSGHASTTFATAAVLERHLGLRGAWPTLLFASYVAASRLHDNRHFASDVVFGAALGTAVGWTVVGRHGKSSYAWLPVRIPGGVAVFVVSQPHLP
jgi:membrane-associated phospholipid phosphatase